MVTWIECGACGGLRGRQTADGWLNCGRCQGRGQVMVADIPGPGSGSATAAASSELGTEVRFFWLVAPFVLLPVVLYAAVRLVFLSRPTLASALATLLPGAWSGDVAGPADEPLTVTATVLVAVAIGAGAVSLLRRWWAHLAGLHGLVAQLGWILLSLAGTLIVLLGVPAAIVVPGLVEITGGVDPTTPIGPGVTVLGTTGLMLWTLRSSRRGRERAFDRAARLAERGR